VDALPSDSGPTLKIDHVRDTRKEIDQKLELKKAAISMVFDIKKSMSVFDLDKIETKIKELDKEDSNNEIKKTYHSMQRKIDDANENAGQKVHLSDARNLWYQKTKKDVREYFKGEIFQRSRSRLEKLPAKVSREVSISPQIKPRGQKVTEEHPSWRAQHKGVASLAFKSPVELKFDKGGSNLGDGLLGYYGQESEMTMRPTRAELAEQEKRRMSQERHVIFDAIKKESNRLKLGRATGAKRFNNEMKIFQGLSTYVETGHLFEKFNVMGDKQQNPEHDRI
jgi:hypothetical protein